MLCLLLVSERMSPSVTEGALNRWSITAVAVPKAIPLLPGAMLIGFTGTPLLKSDKRRSIETFGPYIHTYKYDEAVRFFREDVMPSTRQQHPALKGALLLNDPNTGKAIAITGRLGLALYLLWISIYRHKYTFPGISSVWQHCTRQYFSETKICYKQPTLL